LGRKVVYSDQAWADLQRGEPARSLADTRKPADTSAPGAGRFMWPTEGKIIRGFDTSRKGIDIAGQSGQPIVSVGEGTVLYANNMRGFGNLVIIDHRDGLVSAYGHNKAILVKEGQTVAKGQRIAEMGDLDAESVRLHFEIRQLGKAVDPISFLPSR
jgi:lipoprotein NlpD